LLTPGLVSLKKNKIVSRKHSVECRADRILVIQLPG